MSLFCSVLYGLFDDSGEIQRRCTLLDGSFVNFLLQRSIAHMAILVLSSVAVFILPSPCPRCTPVPAVALSQVEHPWWTLRQLVPPMSAWFVLPHVFPAPVPDSYLGGAPCFLPPLHTAYKCCPPVAIGWCGGQQEHVLWSPARAGLGVPYPSSAVIGFFPCRL